MSFVIDGTNGLTFPDSTTQSTGLKYYTSSQFSFTYNTDYTFTHGLGSVPKGILVYLICTSANNGFAVGDVIYYPPIENYLNGGLYVRSTSTTITLTIMSSNGAPYIYSATTRARINNPYTGWQMYVRAFV